MGQQASAWARSAQHCRRYCCRYCSSLRQDFDAPDETAVVAVVDAVTELAVQKASPWFGQRRSRHRCYCYCYRYCSSLRQDFDAPDVAVEVVDVDGQRVEEL